MEDYQDMLDNDEDITNYTNLLNQSRRPKRINERIDHINKWDDFDFFARFRLSKSTVQYVLNLINDEIASLTERNNALSALEMLLLTLRFYATGSFLMVVGELSGVHYSTASRVVHKVSIAIAKLRPEFIKMPNSVVETSQVAREFYKIAKFPKCIGAIDCTHVKLQSPGGNEAEIYRNRKGYFSMNVQTISDASLKIRDIVARWPGSSHDCTIFNNSLIRGRLVSGQFGNNIIVGDSGYGIRPFLITPLSSPQTEPEKLFQESQIRTRNCVERSYGVWKRRFPVLALELRLKLDRIQAVIVATAVLHNIAVIFKEDVPPVDQETEIQIEFVNNMPAFLPEGNTISNNHHRRRQLINDYFCYLSREE